MACAPSRLLSTAVCALPVFAAGPVAHAVELEFTLRIMATDNTELRTISAGDIDGDGDIDVFTAVSLEDEIRWYENDGAPLPTFTNHVLTNNATMADFVFTADVNNDGFMDVVFNSTVDDRIGWFENDGMLPPTLTERVVDVDPNLLHNILPDGFANGVRQTAAADFDGDGDLDMTTASVDDDRVVLFWNNGATWEPQILTESLDGARCIHAADVDGDGDPDIIAGPWYGGEIVWWDNGGGPDPVFTERVLVAYPPEENDPFWGHAQAWRIYSEDLDGDGDLDVIVGRRHKGVEWYVNDGNTPPTFERRIIASDPSEVFIIKSIFAADMDMDGDIDVLSASRGDDKIAWYENDGAAVPTFTQHVIREDPDGWGPCCPQEGVAAGARSIWAADVDGDSDMDILWAGMDAHTIAWEENHLVDPPDDDITCPLDLDVSSNVDVGDLVAVILAWGEIGVPEDVDESGVVDVGDIVEIILNWGPCPVTP